MSGLIKDVLSFSQLNSAGNSFEKIDLNRVLKDVENDLELLIDQKKAVLKKETLPVVEAISTQMGQLFFNLLSNALKFTMMDRNAEIEITCRPLEKKEVVQNIFLNSNLTYYSITIADNGIGFNQEYAEKIFLMFQRLNTREQFSGTGIGLAMCKKILHNHQGFIKAESTEGTGSKFHIVLPLEQKSAF